MPIVALTVNAMKEDAGKCLKVGMGKPVKKTKLEEVLLKWLKVD